MKPSTYQAAIFAAVKNTKSSIVVQAVAGSGKTTTAIQCANTIDESLSILFLAFNKSIAEELKSRIPPHAIASTFNSLGHRSVCSMYGRVNLNPNKTRKILRKSLSDLEYRKYGEQLQKLISLCKAYCVSSSHLIGTNDTDNNLRFLMRRFDIEIDEDDNPHFLNITRDMLMEVVSLRSEIDYDDQLYLPVVLGLAMPKYDFIFIDESQDTSPVQVAMIQKSLARNGRIMAIGDNHQSIYGFRGSDTGSMNKISQRFQCKEFPLSISYRCAKNIVMYAQQFVPHIEAFGEAENGTVSSWNKYMAKDFRGTDLIMCRNTAPLISFAFACIARRIQVHVLGREIGAQLIQLIERLNADTLFGGNSLSGKLEEWKDYEINRCHEMGQEEKAEGIIDRYNSIISFLQNTFAQTIDGLKKEIISLFGDKENCMKLCTVHKAKGLEAPRAFILDGYLMPSIYAKQEWAKEQEVNLQYVAVTRAKKHLVFIRSSDFEVQT